VTNISDELRSAVISAGGLADWIGNQIDGAVIPDTPRARSAMALFHISFTHHTAILTLLDRGFRVSALALLRPLFESYLRGVWVEVSAKDDELVFFLSGCRSPNFKTLQNAARQISDDKSLAGFAEMFWGRLSHFTHSGSGLINRYQETNGIGDVTPERDCMAAVFFANSIVLLASERASRMIEKPEWECEILNKFNEIKSLYARYQESSRSSTVGGTT
jgi:hypothetical protein